MKESIINNIKSNLKNDLQNSKNNLIDEHKIKKIKSGFNICAEELQEIMNKYRERGTDFNDLRIFDEPKAIKNLLLSLETDNINGISSNTLKEREEKFGSNKVFIEPVPPFYFYFLEYLKDIIVIILIIFSIFEIIVGCTLSDDPSKDWIDGISMIVLILVFILVCSIIDFEKDIKFHNINELQNQKVKYKIIRDGIAIEYISDDILVGDLIMVNYGDIIPADLLLIEGNGIKIDESALTGESDLMKKEPYHICKELLDKTKNKDSKLPSPLILSGTNCMEGCGKAVVLAVGDHSQIGILRNMINKTHENKQTPLEDKLERIAMLIGYFGLGIGIATLVALFIRFGISFSAQMKDYNKGSKAETIMTYFLFNFPEKKSDSKVYGNTNNSWVNPKSMLAKGILDITIICISILVLAIPNRLPLAVSLSLAFSIKALMSYKNLVRKMHACETMGEANYICTDKTGTLTKNEMNVFKVLTGINMFKQVQNIEANFTLTKTTQRQIREDYNLYFKNKQYWEVLKVAIALNVECNIIKLDQRNINGDTEIYETKNKTDKAFIDFLLSLKTSIGIEKQKYLKNKRSYKIFPFDSKRKRMTTFVYHEDFPNKYRLFSKGGGENVSLFCKSYLDPQNCTIKPMDDITLENIKNIIKEFNKDRLRTLYVAYKDITKEEFKNCEKINSEGKLIDEYDMVLLAVFCIRDSLRDGVIEAISILHKASVNVVMVTGDNIVTATAIAKKCGILESYFDLKDLGSDDIEQEQEAMNDESRKKQYIIDLIRHKPKAISGNSFYCCIGGLICEECEKDTNLCKCPKTLDEAIEYKIKYNETSLRPIKKEVIKNIDNFKLITQNLKVMARSQPLHKYALVLGLKDLKNVVAITGDGVNDVPALSKSDVGFAMFSGTDIAKEASDIIILDNNFSSIVVAIIYGRNIYDNIRKLLQFQLSIIFSSCLIIFFCVCIGNETPLTPIQMIWIVLIMDPFGSLALATEPPYLELLHREPIKRGKPVINSLMWKHIVIQSFSQIVILLILYLKAPKFVKEQDIERLAENKIINYCYGEMPGKGDPTHIIYGTKSNWSSGVKLLNNINKDYCGKYKSRQFLITAFKQYSNINGRTVHMTMIFNVIVIYTVFNQINCRIIDDSLNIFKRVGRSLLFILIILIEFILQAFIISFGKSTFHVANNGLTWEQWGICIGFSAITFVISFITKFKFIQKYIDFCIKRIKRIKKIKELDKNEVNPNINNLLISNKLNMLK